MQRGFIALISTLIIATVLLGLALSVSGRSIGARFDALNREYKRVSVGLAESCAHLALLRIAQDYDYTGDEPGLFVNTDDQARTLTCSIGPVAYGANHATVARDEVVFTVSASYPPSNGAWTKLRIVAHVQNPNFATTDENLEVTSWREE